MAVSARVEAEDFSRNFDQLKAAAETGVVEVTRGEQVVGGFLSADELDAYRRLRADAAPEVLRAGDLDDDALRMLDEAAYGRIAG